MFSVSPNRVGRGHQAILKNTRERALGSRTLADVEGSIGDRRGRGTRGIAVGTTNVVGCGVAKIVYDSDARKEI